MLARASALLLVVTAAALRPSPVSALRAPLGGRAQRSRLLVAQYDAQGVQDLPAGWTTGFDETSQSNYYVNGQTGESQWEPPQPAAQQSGYAQQDYAQPGDAQSLQDLPAGWITGFDESSGRTYFYNEQTGATQWEPPRQSNYPQQIAQQGYGANQVLWCMVSASGWGPRFAGKYKLRLGDEEYIGRYDMDLEKPTRPWVSRKQCLVYVGADGTPNLVSCGQYLPTLWRERGGEWVALYKDDSLVLSDGDEVSLDSNDPEGTVFICAQEGAGY